MFSRPSTIFLLLGAAVAVPFAANKMSNFSFPGIGTENKQETVVSEVGMTSGEFSGGMTPDLQKKGTAYQRIASALRMDVSPEWVFSRWNRKSTKLANIDRFGVRVPFVSGTQPDDIAGSLTYYFGSGNQVERISFHGKTGDPRALNHLVTRVYGLTPQQPIHPGEQLFQSRWNNRVKSELRLKLAPVLSSDTKFNAFEVSLELERPDSNHFLEDERIAAALPAVEPEKKKEGSKEPDPPRKWRQGPPMSRSLYFNPQRTKPIVKAE